MQYHGVILLPRTRQEARHVYQSHQRDIESIAETHETRPLAAGIAVEHTGIALRLVGHHAHALPVEAGKAHDDILGIIGLHLKKLAVVHYRPDDFVHIVRLIRIVRNDFIEKILQTVNRVGTFQTGSLFHIILGHITDEGTNHLHGLFFRFGREVRHTGFRGVHARAAQIFLRHILARHCLDYLRPGEEHIRGILHHQDEIGQCRGIYRSACTRTENAGNLRNHTGCLDVTLEDIGITAQSVDTFLDTCAARIIDTDTRRTHFHGLIHHLTDFLGHGLRQRASVHREVLGKYINQTPVDSAASGHYPVSQILFLLHAEVGATMKLEHVHFLETAFIQQHVDTLASRIFTSRMLFFYGLLASSHARFGTELH